MKPYPSVVHTRTSELRPAIRLFEPNNLDEVSYRTPPTPQVNSATPLHSAALLSECGQMEPRARNNIEHMYIYIYLFIIKCIHIIWS